MQKTLRPYQVRMLDHLSQLGHRKLEAPTGSGKTLVMAEAAAACAKRGERVVISTPFTEIAESFADVLLQQCGIEVSPSDDGSVSSRMQDLNAGGVVVCTHAGLCRAFDHSQANFKKITLFIDEAHHAGERQKLGQAASFVGRNRGSVKLASATQFRSDGLLVEIPGMGTFSRTLAEHMAEGFAPSYVQSRVVPYRSEKASKDTFRGRSLKGVKNPETLAKEIVSAWVNDGKPKSVVAMPNCGMTRELIEATIKAFERFGARVLNAYGSDKDTNEEFKVSLRKERVKSWDDSRVDVVVGCNRVIEGMDWIHCNAVYCVGAPSSPVKILQLLGRAMRPKDDSCPEQFRTNSSMVFFVPSSDARLESLSAWHSRHLLLVCGLLEDSTNVRLWRVLEAVGRISCLDGQSPLGPRDAKRSMYMVLFREADAMLSNMGKDSTVENLVYAMAEIGKDREGFSVDEARQIVVERQCASSEYAFDRMLQAFNRVPTKHQIELFKELALEFAREVVRPGTADLASNFIRLNSESVSKFGRSLSQITAGRDKLVHVESLFRRLTGLPFDESMASMFQAGKHYCERVGERLMSTERDVHDFVNKTLSAIHGDEFSVANA